MVHECELVNAKCRHRTVILTEIFNKRECECERKNVALGHHTKVFVILSIHENGMVVHLTPLHTSPPSCDGYLEFSRVQIPWSCLTKPAKGPGGTSGAHTQQLRGMVKTPVST